jgi:hypothetical protein
LHQVRVVAFMNIILSRQVPWNAGACTSTGNVQGRTFSGLSCESDCISIVRLTTLLVAQIISSNDRVRVNGELEKVVKEGVVV